MMYNWLIAVIYCILITGLSANVFFVYTELWTNAIYSKNGPLEDLMEFTFSFYKKVLSEVKEHLVFDFFNSKHTSGRVFLRHDVDIFPENIRNLCEVESELGIRSIFFFQPDSPFYNFLSKTISKTIAEIAEQGFQIGLHIDAATLQSTGEVNEEVHRLFNFYSGFFPLQRIVSFHRPPQRVLNNLIIPGFINTYEDRFFKNIRYYADSKRNHFYEGLRDSLQRDRETNLQLVTHPYWWDFDTLNIESLYSRLLATRRRSLERALSENVQNYKHYFTRG